MFCVDDNGNDFAQQKASHVIAGNKLYREKKFDKALPEYLKAKETSATDPVVNYNLGNAYFQKFKV